MCFLKCLFRFIKLWVRKWWRLVMIWVMFFLKERRLILMYWLWRKLVVVWVKRFSLVFCRLLWIWFVFLKLWLFFFYIFKIFLKMFVFLLLGNNLCYVLFENCLVLFWFCIVNWFCNLIGFGIWFVYCCFLFSLKKKYLNWYLFC